VQHAHCKLVQQPAMQVQTAMSGASMDAPAGNCTKASLEPAQQLMSAERVRHHHPSLAVPRLLVQRRAKHRPVRHLNSSNLSSLTCAHT